MIKKFYEGKTLFLTGTTGFLAKVVLEKLLRSIPGIKRIYVLIRPKAGKTPMERFKSDILNSKVFERAQKEVPNWSEYVQQVVVPVEGDLTKEGLGIKPEEAKRIQSELNVVINSAAAVDFINTLANAMRDNFHNTMRVLEFAKGCPNLDVFVQVSTAYVNSNRTGFIEEKIYNPSFDVEKTIEYIQKLPEHELEKQTEEITKGYPNTYTFSKFLTEHKVRRERGPMSVAIVRPTIIGASYEEPFPGWVDAVTALSGVYFYVGLGITKEVYANPKVVLDVVAVDICSNMIIAAGAYQANKGTLEVFHVGSSQRNPITNNRLMHMMVKYLTDHRPRRIAGAKPQLDFYKNETMYKIVFWMKRKLPVMLYGFLGKAIKNEEMQDKAALYKKALSRATMLNAVFKHFTTTTWVFDTSHTDVMSQYFSKEDIENFPYDMGKIDWERYSMNYLYGLWTYIGKEKFDPPYTTNYENLFHNKQYTEFAGQPLRDVRFIMSMGGLLDMKDTDLRMRRVLEVEDVKQAMAKYIDRKRSELIRKKAPVREEKLKEEAYVQAMKYAKRVECRMQKWTALTFALFTHKFLKRIFSKININPTELNRLREIKDADKGPIVLIPNHRSYMDFLIITYMMFAYGFDAPYVAAAEDFLKIPLISSMFRSAGAFFVQRGQKADPIYRAILREYVKRLLMEGNSLKFYIEGKRSRRGKLLRPKLGMLKMVLEAYLEKRVPEVNIIPVSISYERILEAESFIQEFMGEGKQNESLGRVIKGFTTLFDKFGTVHVSFGQPVKVSKFVKRNGTKLEAENKENLAKLGEQILYSISENRVTMATEVVASLVLVKKKMTFPELVEEFEMVRKDLVSNKGVQVGFPHVEVADPVIKNALNYLKIAVRSTPISSIGQLIAVKPGDASLMLLGYYRNSLGHVYVFEGFLACCLFMAGDKPVSKEWLRENTNYLLDLLKMEYLTPLPSFDSTLASLKTKGVVTESPDGLVKLNSTPVATRWTVYLASFIWPLVECYWGAALYLSSLTPEKPINYGTLCRKVQWFGKRLCEEGILKNVEAYNFDSVKAAIEQYMDIGMLKSEEQTPGEGTEVKMDWDEKKCRTLIEKLNGYRLVPAMNIEEVIKVVDRVIKTEFLMATKI